MDSIVVRITNGLGNQMFQYALGRRLALINNCPLKLDFSEYNEDDNTNHEGIELNLYRFNIKAEIAERSEIDKLIPQKAQIENRIIRALYNRYKKRFGKYNFYKKNYIEDVWKSNMNILKAKPPLYLNGGWFNLRYFEEIREELIEELTLKDELKNDYYSELLNKISASKNSVGIHFRRKYGLYPNARRVFGVLDVKYYHQALEYLNQQLGNLELFVFADDIAWVKENFKPSHKMTIIERSEHLTDSHDWELLKSCEHQIISNSTFSWWANYLNTYENQIIIFPRVWYAEASFQKRYETGKAFSPSWTELGKHESFRAFKWKQ